MLKNSVAAVSAQFLSLLLLNDFWLEAQEMTPNAESFKIQNEPSYQTAQEA